MAREMKDSGIEWIGEIPNNWNTIKLKYVATLQPSCDTSNLNENSLITYTPMEFIKTGYYVPNTIIFGEVSSSLTPYNEGDIVLAKVTPCFENGNIAIMSNLYSGFGLGSSELYVIRANHINTKFLFYWLQNEAFVQMGCSTMTGTGGLKRVASSFINNCPLTVPESYEQQLIADFLDTQCANIDSVIEKTRVAIEEYKKLKQAVITRAVTKGIRPNREMKDSGIEWIGEIYKDYQLVRLKTCLKKQLQYGANESGVSFDSSLPRYIRITDITPEGKLKNSGALSLPEEIANDYILIHDDVLLARSGATVGKAFIYKSEYGKAAFAGYLIRASLNKCLLLADLLFYYTQSSIYEDWKKQIFVQATIQNIGADRYKELPIILPSINEQSEIVAYLDEKTAAINSLIRKKEQLITELEAYKKSLIYEYVTGKKEVPVHAH